MERLKRTIGPAPSEDPEAFRKKLLERRSIISSLLSSFRERSLKASGTKTKAKTKTPQASKKKSEIDNFYKELEAMGLTLQEAVALAKKSKEESTRGSS